MIVMFYGSGMPILYLVAACSYFMTYWCDKLLLFYFYRKPVMLDNYIGKSSIFWHKYALLLHLIGGVFMLSNSNILPSIQDSIANSWKDSLEKSGYKRLSKLMSQQMIFYVITFLFLLALYMIWNYLGANIVKCIRLARKMDVEKKNHFESDFYECVSFRTLRMELEDTLKIQKSMATLDQSVDAHGMKKLDQSEG